MKSAWKWLGAVACGLALLVVVDRINREAVADDAPSYERSGDGADRLDRIADKLDRLLDLMESRRSAGGPPHDRPHRDLPPEVRERMHEARAEMKERMEKAREKFRELEERVKSLEAEVERLKTARAG